MSLFQEFYELDVNEKAEDRDGLKYLSWAWAWAEFKKKAPRATYQIKPWTYDENLGYMVYTSVTNDGLTYDMWLPVMDSHNKAMKTVQYEIKTKYKTFKVEPATMFDINRAYMRCLTKNLAMFGLGLYIYAGEDLPESSDKLADTGETKTETIKLPSEKGSKETAYFLATKICKECNLSFDKEARARGMTPEKMSDADYIKLGRDLAEYAFQLECDRIGKGKPRAMEYYKLTDKSTVEEWKTALEGIKTLSV